MQFDTQPDNFCRSGCRTSWSAMAELLEADYDTLALEINDSESRQRAPTSEPAPPTPLAAPAVPAARPRRSPRLSQPPVVVCAARRHVGGASGTAATPPSIARSAGGRAARATRRAPAGVTS